MQTAEIACITSEDTIELSLLDSPNIDPTTLGRPKVWVISLCSPMMVVPTFDIHG